jgi:hypothetical protein
MLASQNCTPNHSDILNDDMLIAKVSGNFISPYIYGTNNWEYANDGSFNNQYIYGNRQNNREKWKPLQQIQYINTGSNDFNYIMNLPEKVIDNSTPYVDMGYWKLYYNNAGLVTKTGLSTSSNSDPAFFENYTYNNRGLLKTLIKDEGPNGEPKIKVDYFYDESGNMTRFDYYFPSSIFGAPARNSKQASSIPMFQQIFKNKGSITSRLQSQSEYTLVLSATITSDNKKNPFHQQGRLLFYPVNRNYFFNDFFIPLMKYNPLTVTYTFNPDIYGVYSITQTFDYRYNNKKYPTDITEIVSDPNSFTYGDYTRKSKIEYTRND